MKSNLPAAIEQDSIGLNVQAVFCIDVRSEVFRRALEACSSSIQTLGFAGFFGLPISYTPLGTIAERPQLPGLLAPKLRVSESCGSQRLNDQATKQRQRGLRFKSIWKDFRSSATSTFTFVEACGLFYLISLVKSTLPTLTLKGEASDKKPAKHSCLRPSISYGAGHDAPSVEALCDLVAGIFANMSLTKGFARLLLLTGHGSQTVNNPHAAGLDCGACGGQTGEVNARVLAGLLNDPAIRAGLAPRGIVIPDTTYVLAALHNTTTDEVTIFDTDLLPESHAADLARLQSWLQQAGHRARTERAVSVGIDAHGATSRQTLLNQFRLRSRDWSQVRPEWGLANNAVFLIAPRTRSRGLDLHGRVFLHEYQSSGDPNGNVLEAIMTAPMLVTNWINMQYYASTVDHRQYGSGNKVLHNVVGGRLGVFEGNGGDLRIGLPLQSLHDGHVLRHTPLRLSVFIEAPQSSIGAVIGKHKVVETSSIIPGLIYSGLRRSQGRYHGTGMGYGNRWSSITSMRLKKKWTSQRRRMRKVLLVHHERYLDRALQDVVRLVGFERQRVSQDEVLDLLAVILTPLSGDGHFVPEDQTCELGCLTNYSQLFSPDYVSVSGIWLLLTASQSADSTKRQETLRRILMFLEAKEGVRNRRTVIPVFRSDESQDAIAQQIKYLESEHHRIPLTRPLAIDFHKYPPDTHSVWALYGA